MTIGLKKCNITEAKDKVFKIGIIKMLKVLIEEMNKSINEFSENTKSAVKWSKQYKT